MKRVAWLTDIHLEFLKPWDVEGFFDEIRAEKPDLIIITGDIISPPALRSSLLHMRQYVDCDVVFVLGNHDFYGSDIADVRAAMTQLTQEDRGVAWLPAKGIIALAADSCLVGHDGWSDGRYGYFLRSPIILNDYVKIKQLQVTTIEERLKRLQALGDEAADYLRAILPQAIQHYPHIYVAMHPPPFIEACWYEGKTPDIDNEYLPHFTCKAVGDVLLDVADKHPSTQFTVLCGHVHHGGIAKMRDNLIVLTGAAEYEKPVVQQVFEFG